MGKWSQYHKKFQNSWLKDPLFEKWLEEVRSDGEKAFCKVCRAEIRAHRADLVKHSTSAKHKQNIAKISGGQKSIKSIFCKKEDKISKFEIRLSIYVACHSAIRSVNHLGELLNEEMPSTSSSTSLNLRLHRTKCSALIKNVISPVILQEQVNDLKGSPFSLIIDESTDVACQKHLCICVRYYNTKRNEVVTEFLGLIAVTSTTAEALLGHLKEYFSDIGVSLNNCFAIGTDGASSLCGVNHSVYTLMKEDIPNLILIKCICHSLHLACSHASDTLPSNIDFMIRETHNWFHRSALRRESYLEVHRTINDGKDPLQMIPLSGTRWLARSQSVKRLLDQWDSLTVHFQLASSNCDKYLARQLNSMYSDPVNKLYFTFLRPVLSDFEKINLMYQKTEADQCTLHDDLENFILSFLRRIVYSQHVSLAIDFQFQSIFLPIQKVDFGFEFSSLKNSYQENNVIDRERLNDVEQRCHQFLIIACKQLLMRMPNDVDALNKIKNLSPNVILNHTRPPFSELPLTFADQSKLSEIENQWRLLLTTNWANIFEGEVPKFGVPFWTKVATTKNAADELIYSDLAKFALKMYSIPISNAFVERMFSRVTSVKTKLRNRMSIKLLSSLLRIKAHLESNKLCCSTFEPSPAMLKFDSSIYKNESGSEEENELLEVEL